MRYRDWEIGGFNRDLAVEYCRKEGINPLISVFLASRGIDKIEDARSLIGITPTEIFDPFLMADMDKAVARIRAAVDKHEHITIYGDYDVDGMTSCAMLAHWLQTQGADHDIYIPGRQNE